ncbi:MAG: Gfo/Idh/MocA family oxidoreductase [Oscillospiraceae bacterium]|nr:Gfo/Idh/MocA family oxidoreductase [Oscillospiraceae bacterium]
MAKLKIGIIGTGGIAGAHLNHYNHCENAEVVAGCDIVPGKAAEFFKRNNMAEAKAFDSAEEMLAKVDLDAVSVCTYAASHAKCAILALEHGLPVLLEKPMCVTIEEAKAIVAAEKKSGKFVSVGFQPRYDPNIRRVKEIIESGMLGKVYYIQTGGGRPRNIPGNLTFLTKATAGGGSCSDAGCYPLDFALNSIGNPKPLTVSATLSTHFGNNPKYCALADQLDVDDFSSAYIRLEGGVVLDYRMSWFMHMDTAGDFLFLGTEAGLKIKQAGPVGAWDGSIGDIILMHEVHGSPVQTVIPPKNRPEDIWKRKICDFVDAVASGNNLAPIPTDQIIYNQAIIDGMMRSSALGREVECVF